MDSTALILKNDDSNPILEVQTVIKEWLSIDDEISKLNKALRERKKKKEELHKIIIQFMKSKDIPQFNLNDGNLVLTETIQKKPLSKVLLSNLCSSYFNNNTLQANELVNYIHNNRGTTTKDKLKRKKVN